MENIAINFISYIFPMKIYWSRTSNICSYSIYHFGWYNIHNFITHNHWSIGNIFEIFTILVNTCGRIPTVIFLALAIVFIFPLTCFIMPFLIWITSWTIDLAFRIIWNMLYQCFCLISIFYHVKFQILQCLYLFFFRDTYFCE